MENSILGGLIRQLDNLVWGPALLLLLLGSGSYLMLRLRFLPLRNLKFALKCAFGGDSPPGKNTLGKGSGRASSGSVSSLASLTTELATTLGIGNIIGVAMAMVLGGPGALFWMVATSIVGMATKLVESMLSVKYRGKNQKGQSAGGPMYTCLHAFPGKPGRILGTLFALLAVTASFGMGNMTQSNSIADTLWVSFRVPKADTGLFLTILTVLVVIGGISVIGKVTQVLVPFMGVLSPGGSGRDPGPLEEPARGGGRNTDGGVSSPGGIRRNLRNGHGVGLPVPALGGGQGNIFQ